MFSKQLKSFSTRKPMGKIKEFLLYDLYFPVDSFFRRTKERVCRSYSYAKFGYMHFDFDGVFIYNLMSFKLKRIKDALENGCAVQEEVDMKALDESIKICDRLFAQEYEDKYYDLLEQKWGKAKLVFGSESGSSRSVTCVRKRESLLKIKKNIPKNYSIIWEKPIMNVKPILIV